MNRLSKKEFWDKYHREVARAPDSVGLLQRGLSQTGLAHVLRQFELPYSHHFILNVLARRYLPKGAEHRYLEIGCAPGEYLIRFQEVLGYQMYGMDYTEAGVQLTRKLFRQHGLNPENIIEADFFDASFQEEYQHSFDVVASLGFIEHFDSPREVIQRHIDLLKPGGYLFVTVPNFRGFGELQMRLVDPEQLASHNLDIMDQTFRRQFDQEGLDPLYCGHAGTFELVRLANPASPLRRLVVGALWRCQRVLDTIAIAVRFPGFETAFFSPHLVYIGRRRAETRASLKLAPEPPPKEPPADVSESPADQKIAVASSQDRPLVAVRMPRWDDEAVKARTNQEKVQETVGYPILPEEQGTQRSFAAPTFKGSMVEDPLEKPSPSPAAPLNKYLSF